jgi:hypothetical protein
VTKTEALNNEVWVNEERTGKNREKRREKEDIAA